MPRPLSDIRPIFIIGNPRSGTTLLRLMWNAHPGVIMPHECHFLHELYAKYAETDPFSERDIDRFLDDLFAVRRFDSWQVERAPLRDALMGLKEPGYAHIADGVYRSFAAGHGRADARWGDKNTHFIVHIPQIVSLFPNARFIHLIRDGRGAVCSMKNIKMGTFLFPDGRGLDMNDIVTGSKLWRTLVPLGSAEGAKLGPQRYLEVKYHDLLREPERTCRRMCKFAGEEYSTDMLDKEIRTRDMFIPDKNLERFHENTTKDLLEDRLSYWQRELKRRELVLIESLIGNTLERYGYERFIDNPKAGESVAASLSVAFNQPIRFFRRAKAAIRHRFSGGPAERS